MVVIENSQAITTVDELRKHIAGRMHLKYECVDLVLESGKGSWMR